MPPAALRAACTSPGSTAALVFRAITISTGPWRDATLAGAPYDEKAGSVTTALTTDAAILAAARQLRDGR